MFDPKRGSMQDYPIQAQIDIIRRGKFIFNEWFGEFPLAHRAGDWGADENTIKALKENDIFVDSSLFYGWPKCQLNKSLTLQNNPADFMDIFQLPASVYQCNPIGMFHPYRLLSTDGNSFLETMQVLRALKNNRVPVINLVYHSFSFLKWNRERTAYTAAKNRIRKFARLLKELSQSADLEVKT